MPLTLEDKYVLTQLARARWLEAHAAFIAYERDYRRNKRIGEWLRRGTLGAALMTAACTSALSKDGRIGLSFAVIPGLLTAALSALEQAYTPTKQAQVFWECRIALQRIKEDLVSSVIALRGVSDLNSGMKLFNQISTRFSEATRTQFELQERDSKEAEQAFLSSALAQMTVGLKIGKSVDEDVQGSLGSDAPDVIAVIRQRSPRP